ncbi:MAG TPA: ATP-binding cassette domain-containing protein, partial [Actinomycetota bacterium]|nr:ATP-binding cassette domain-containing protein [Actinomycetota bacterium]
MARAIRFERVWKRFRLGLTRRRHKRNLRDAVSRDPQRSGLGERTMAKYIWALAGVSFNVDEGEAVGIVGPNGSGKSTTLRLASRVSVPWSGLVRTRGRVGALIELKA